ncbi:MAG TPA: ROK family protein [Pseudolysinimonas sp.]|nr:ROK family protein [Pseudolysinimonas sp.]
MAQPHLRAPRVSGVGSDQLRRHNLSAILTLLHHDGSQPRSALTAQTGLNRSTVAALVAELVEHGLVHETDPDPTNLVGRPSPTVNADERNVVIAINPEVDAVTVGVVALGGRVLRRIRSDTAGAPTAAEAVSISADIVASIVREPGRVLGIGVAVPGLVRAADGVVRLAPHLEWADEPFAEMLATATGLRVSVGNDAGVGALVEHIYGAGRGIDDLIYLNGGPSGIGGGVIAAGSLLGGASGYAGEFGHTRGGGTDDADLESLVRRSDLLAAVGRAAATPDELDDLVLHSDDPAVLELVHAQLEALAPALGDAINILNPRLIVLGGFLAAILQRDPGHLASRVAAHALTAAHEDVQITRAALGSDLLMVGAAELTFAQLLADPAGYLLA